MIKPRIHMYRGRWYCVGSGAGFGRTPLAAYQNWLCCTTAFQEVLEA